MVSMPHSSNLAVASRALLEAGAAPSRVLYFEEDRSYLVLDADTPEDPSTVTVGYLAPVCVHCLLDQHPSVGRGMDVARRTGGARLVEGAWLEERSE
jgi:hypothetical protein